MRLFSLCHRFAAVVALCFAGGFFAPAVLAHDDPATLVVLDVVPRVGGLRVSWSYSDMSYVDRDRDFLVRFRDEVGDGVWHGLRRLGTMGEIIDLDPDVAYHVSVCAFVDDPALTETDAVQLDVEHCSVAFSDTVSPLAPPPSAPTIVPIIEVSAVVATVEGLRVSWLYADPAYTDEFLVRVRDALGAGVWRGQRRLGMTGLIVDLDPEVAYHVSVCAFIPDPMLTENDPVGPDVEHCSPAFPQTVFAACAPCGCSRHGSCHRGRGCRSSH